MKIVTPLTNVDCYEPLVEAGADEFFCGIIPFRWLEKYGSLMPINRRESVVGKYNITEMNSMKIINRMVEKYHVPVKITFNAHYYISEQYPILHRLILDLMDIGFNTFIISDFAFIAYLRDKEIKCDIHVSGESEVTNRLSMEFFNQFNVSRYVFPRKITLNDMKECILKNSIENIEYEAFVMNSLCRYSGAFCNAVHSDDMIHICDIPFKLTRETENSGRFKIVDKIINKSRAFSANNLNNLNIDTSKEGYKLGSSGCGACRIKELRDIGVTHGKVVGRGNKLENLVKDIRDVKKINDMSINIADNNDFVKNVKDDYLNGK
jgi:collagenase-like PrtC family protease